MADNAAFFHLVHDARSSRVTELQPALEHGNGGLPGLQDYIDRGREHFVSAVVGAVDRYIRCRRVLAALSALGGLLVDFGHDLVGIFRRIRALDEGHNLLHLVVGDEAALHTLGLSLPQRCIEHVALADQLLCARRIENDTRLHRGGNRERNTRRDIRLHQASNHVGRRSLRRDDQMHARRTAHLRHTANGLFDLLGRNQHQVRQLVDHDHDLRHRLKFAARACLFIVRRQIAHARVRHQTVPTHHLRHCPLKRARRLLGVGHDRDEQVRNAVINAELNHFGVDHDELDLFGLRLIEKRNDERVHTHRLTGAGRTGDEQVRQSSDVADDAVAADVLADGEGDLRFALFKLRRVDHVARKYRRDDAVRYFNTDHRNFLGNRRDADARRAKRQSNIVREIRHLRELYTPAELELIPRDRRTSRDVDDRRLNAEGFERIAEPFGVLAHFLGSIVRRAGALLQ